MTEPRIDIDAAFTIEEGLPRPQWDVLATWVESRVSPDAHADTWTDISRQWMEKLASALGRDYQVEESDICLMLMPVRKQPLAPLLGFVELCREGLLATLPGIVEFQTPGKQVILILRDENHYYQYLSAYYPEGRHGGSGGMQIRQGFPHVVVRGTNIDFLKPILAHELTHAALQHRNMPLWLEESLTQRAEKEIAGRNLSGINEKGARLQRRYWRRFGLRPFWTGAGFHAPGKVAGLNYQLAIILFELMAEACRPRWLGLSRHRQQGMFAFLRDATAADAGEAAALQHLGHSLGDLAGQFLGPGDWSPRIADDPIFTARDDAPPARLA